MKLLDVISKFKHKSELRESQDEILNGEIFYYMATKNWPCFGMSTSNDEQTIKFRSINDPALFSVRFRLDRKTGGSAVSQAVLGSKATFYITAEVKNNIADPDDVLNQFSTDFKNIAKISLLGQVKVNHQFNSVFAEKGTIIDINNYIGDKVKRTSLTELISSTIDELRTTLEPYKK